MRGEMGLDQFEHLAAQVIAFQQVAELTDGGLVGHRFAAEIDADELAHGGGIIQCLLGARVGQIEPLLKKVDAQYCHQESEPRRETPFASP